MVLRSRRLKNVGQLQRRQGSLSLSLFLPPPPYPVQKAVIELPELTMPLFSEILTSDLRNLEWNAHDTVFACYNYSRLLLCYFSPPSFIFTHSLAFLSWQFFPQRYLEALYLLVWHLVLPQPEALILSAKELPLLLWYVIFVP
jgi:hypothetical protein